MLTAAVVTVAVVIFLAAVTRWSLLFAAHPFEERKLRYEERKRVFAARYEEKKRVLERQRKWYHDALTPKTADSTRINFTTKILELDKQLLAIADEHALDTEGAEEDDEAADRVE